MRNFAVVEYLHSTPHLEASIEAAFHFALEGDSVSYYYLGWDLPFVDFRRNRFGMTLDSLLRISYLLGRGGPPLPPRDFFGAINQLLPDLASIVAWEKPVGLATSHLPVLPRHALKNIDALAQFKFDSVPFGLGLANSVAKVTGRIDPPLRRVRHLLNLIFRAQLGAYRWMSSELKEKNFTDVLVFNGRFAVPQALGLAAKQAGANVWFHERGGRDNSGFSLLPCSTHSPKGKAQEIIRRWPMDASGPSSSQRAIAESFFSAQNRGLDREGVLWVRDPVNFDTLSAIAQPGSQKIVFFASTEGEFEFFGTNGPFSIFGSQREALQEVSDLAVHEGFGLIVRAHPNVSKQNKSEINWWRAFKKRNQCSNVMVITAEQNIDSFELLAMADCVVTWHSTMALHAVFNGKPSVTLAETPGVHVTPDLHLPRTKAEFLSMLRAPPRVGDHNSVLPIGYSLSVSEYKYRFFHPSGLRTGSFGGARLGH